MAALNYDCFNGPERDIWMMRARGISVMPDGSTAMNGGMHNPYREHLKRGQVYYRFVSATAPADAKVTGGWWLDHDSLTTICGRHAYTSPRPATSSGPPQMAWTIREWLALTHEWNSIDQVVFAPLCAPLDAYTGAGKFARGNHADDVRAFGYPESASLSVGVKQTFIPGLKGCAAEAFPMFRTAPLSRLREIMLKAF